MQSFMGCPLTCFSGSVTKAEPFSAGLGRSYFWCLVAGACAYILKPCCLHGHRYGSALETSLTPGSSISPGSNSGLTTDFASKATSGTSQITAGWSSYYQQSDFPMATSGIQVDCHYKLPSLSKKLYDDERSTYFCTSQPNW